MTDGIWSYWSPPAGPDHMARWGASAHHLYSWILSVGVAARWLPRRVLYTDSAGARLLVDRLRLPFTDVHCILDPVPRHLERLWALGKLYAYRAHAREYPFVHVDSDVYLWGPLPESLQTSPVLAQNPERFRFEDSYYAPAEILHAVRATGGWLPDEFEWYAGIGGNEACCCGVFGGTDVDFIGDYAETAIAMVERNEPAWRILAPGIDPNVVVEQYLLSAFHYFHCRERRYAGVRFAYLFETESDAYDPKLAAARRFTHLIAGAKTDPVVLSRVAARVQRDFPQYAARVHAALIDAP